MTSLASPSLRAELATALHLLEQQTARLLTLAGPPGVGKTRLAQAVAIAAWDRFPDGAVVVGLASLDDPGLVGSPIKQSLDLRSQGRGRRWYLVSWDPERHNWRTFRVDRIASVTQTGIRFPPREPPEGEVAAYVSRRISAAAWRYRARITVHAPAGVVAGRITPAVGVVEPLDEHTCVLDTGADANETIAVYVGLLGVDFTVSEPPELIAKLRGLSVRAGELGRSRRRRRGRRRWAARLARTRLRASGGQERASVAGP